MHGENLKLNSVRSFYIHILINIRSFWCIKTSNKYFIRKSSTEYCKTWSNIL